MAAASVLHAIDGASGEGARFVALATRELLTAGVAQTVLHGGGSEVAARFDPRVRLLELAPSRGFAFALARALRGELRANAYAAVHLHGTFSGPLAQVALSRATRGTPTYYSPHGRAALLCACPLCRAANWASERIAGRSCQPVVSGRSEARQLERLTRRPAAVLDAPVDARLFELRTEACEPPRVLTVARSADARSAEVFAEVAARFHYAGEVARFVWLGSLVNGQERLLRAAGVELAGAADEPTLRLELARARVYVQPAATAGPAAVLDAMSAGLACVALAPDGEHDTVAGDRTGLIATDVSQLALQVKTLLDQPERALALGRAARDEALERFHPRRVGRALLALYRLERLEAGAT